MTTHVGPDLLQVLDRTECLARLAGRRVARVAISRRALPEILPVRYQLDGEQLRFDVGGDASVLRAIEGRVIAFEVGDMQPCSGAGWSVTVVGQAARVERADDTTTLDRGTVVRLSTTRMTGWSLGPQGTGDAAT